MPLPVDLTAHQEWEKSNPLRAWRDRNYLGRLTVAGMLGVTQGAVQAWEAGSNRPRDEHMNALGRLIGEKDLARKWDTWRASSPALQPQ